MNQIIKFIEKDVDGLGTDAEVMLLLDTDLPLTNGHRYRLEKAIADIKKEWDEDEWDTDSVSVVDEALTRVFGEDIKAEVVLPDIEVEF